MMTKVFDKFSLDMLQMGGRGRRIFIEKMSPEVVEIFRTGVRDGEEGLEICVQDEKILAWINTFFGLSVVKREGLEKPCIFSDDIVTVYDGKTWYRIEVL